MDREGGGHGTTRQEKGVGWGGVGVGRREVQRARVLESIGDIYQL